MAAVFSFAPPGLVRSFRFTHGLRRGLRSFAASRLVSCQILFSASSFSPDFSIHLLGEQFVARFWVFITMTGLFIFFSCPAGTSGRHTGIPVVKGSKCCRDFRLQGAFGRRVRSVENLVELKTEFRIALGIDRVVGFAGASVDGLKL